MSKSTSPKSGKKTAETMEKQKGFLGYDPYKVFDSRKGCILAIALCTLFIVITVLNIVLNGTWLSLIFVVFYGLIIRNRLRRLRSMHTK